MVVPTSAEQDTNSAKWSLNSAKCRVGTPYFDDWHMLSPEKSRTRLGRNNRDIRSRDETVKDQIYHLRNDRGDQGGSPYLELRSHVSLDKIAQFDGRRYRSDDSLQWLKRFIYEMKGPPKIQYERSGADAADHVEQFLLNCGDEDIMDMLYPLQFNDIHRVEQIINKKILGEKRKKQRDQLVSGRSRDELHRDERRNGRRNNKRTAAEMTREMYAEMVVEVIDAEKRVRIDSAEPVVEANFVFAFVGEAGWPEGLDGTDEGMCDSGGNERESEESDEDDSAKFDRRVRMSTLVMGAVNDRRVKILLDTEANVSAVSSTLARKLRLKQHASRDQQIDIQGIGKDKVSTTHKALVKVTLGWEVVYEFEALIMPHHDGDDLILGADILIPAGVRLNLYNSAVKLPDEVVVQLFRSLKDTDDQAYGLQTADGPAEAVCLSDRATAEFRLRRKQPSNQGLLDQYPDNVGYVRLNSAKYRNWQVLACESAIDKDFLYKEQELYADWISRQSPAVDRKPYHWSKGVKERPPRKGKQLTCAERWTAVDAKQKATDAQEVVAESKKSYSDDQDGLDKLEGINSAMEPPSACRNQQGVMEEERDAEFHLTRLDTPKVGLEGQTNSTKEDNQDSDGLKRLVMQWLTTLKKTCGCDFLQRQ
ncbi:Hypothetical protein PHPALM_7400 [Phytophthora palmivora]|uniref:Peptidase A2 domain-containing protein n=1 Tax=Phytophthora palmivora TaxID=4796 RepID=A0A2P4YCH1_9STRA|nr:Hypothetical protein PHPALM_7400 [Phytophthora palmivora]